MRHSISELAEKFRNRPETRITITCDYDVVNESARAEMAEKLRSMFLETIHVEFKPLITFPFQD